ncbi:hypothetical protein [Streptomyces sp. NPDC006510]|uniref:hypothetical protein n=1 Tax=Streptomyces sp. NPDC006510 TaxID=3155600 RepID=UPI0033B8B5F5
MLRRTLSLEMAYRPGGVLATKIHMKHIAAATTEGYASRPGGAQAELLAEVNKYQSERNLQLVLEEFRNYQEGVLPAGPGARSLTDFFVGIDAQLDAASAAAPKDTAQRPRRAQSADQAGQGTSPQPGELLLAHRPVPGTLPQAGWHPDGRSSPGRDV